MSGLALFLQQALRHPRQVVAVAPSSGALAREMAAGLGPQTGQIAEFGAGTGNLTRAILGRGIDPAALTLFEMNPVFCRRLGLLFPGTRVENRPAQQIRQTGLCGLGAVVSGLPLLSMPLDLQLAIVGGAFSALRPGGHFIQFTYGPRPPMAGAVAAELGLVWTASQRIWGNLPPARVYRYQRADA